MPSVFIGREQFVNAQYWNKNEKQLYLSVLRAAGVPILGCLILREDPQYTYKKSWDHERFGFFISWDFIGLMQG